MNALAGLMNPGAIGEGVVAAFETGRKKRLEFETENALRTYAMDPSAGTARQVAAVDPRLGIQLGNVEAQRAETARQQQLAAQQEQQKQMGTFRRLLKHAAQSPEGWQQALGAAQNLGVDTSQIPAEYNPQWAQQQLFIMEALEAPEGTEALSTAGKLAADMGYKPGTPEHAEQTRKIFLADAAKPYTGAQGETRLYIPQLTASGQPAPPQPGTVVGGYTYKGGDPKSPDAWEKPGGPTQPASATFRP